MAVEAKSSTVSDSTRWAQLLWCVICMILIANLQYGWTLFVHPMSAAHHWKVAEIQFAFSLFIALETWLTPIEGWLVDYFGEKRGPKVMVTFGGVMVAIGWIINANAGTLGVLYLGTALSGVGAGAVYVTCVGNAVKWFPERRGLAVGLTAAGFGAGAALTVIPIREVIASSGYETAFFWFGLIQGGVLFLIAFAMRAPFAGETPGTEQVKVQVTTRSFTPGEMLLTPTFWVLYVMFILVAASGLMATAQIALVARDFHLANNPILFGMTVLSLALLVDNVANGAARPLFGWISDMIGRENTMAIAFALGGISYWLLGTVGTSPWAFVIFAGLIFLTWGEIFSLFPSTCTDTYGRNYATANLALLYTAKGASAFLVPLANVLKSATGSWHAVFVVTAIMNFVVVALALVVLKPLRSRQIAESSGPTRAAASPAE
ncbi:MAG TPA: oxalate/formate MFS antiporter [Stellaceae bacterium]|nr:oxalate/formate MFS antiporter [Stellaceae bacterium]